MQYCGFFVTVPPTSLCAFNSVISLNNKCVYVSHNRYACNDTILKRTILFIRLKAGFIMANLVIVSFWQLYIFIYIYIYLLTVYNTFIYIYFLTVYILIYIYFLTVYTFIKIYFLTALYIYLYILSDSLYIYLHILSDSFTYLDIYVYIISNSFI